MRIIACLLFAVIATASSSGPRDASELIQEYRAAAFLPIGRPVTYTPIKYLSEREVSTAVLAAGAKRAVIVSGILQAADIRDYCKKCRALLCNPAGVETTDEHP